MKKKGFTLVELLGVIILLGILSAIAVPTIAKTIKSSREKAYQDQLGIMEAGARNWVADHVSLLPEENGASIMVTLGELREGGYVDKDLKNPKTKSYFSDESYVEIKNLDGGYEYTAVSKDR